jgi:adenosylmethionine-8-amino-7-oxononanoate aminotransferase
VGNLISERRVDLQLNQSCRNIRRCIAIGPPYIIEENDMDAVVDAIDQAMADVLG